MISTRLHGTIDYAVAALLEGLAASQAVSPPIGRVLAAAGAYHTCYALLTDYEAGLLPRLTMRRHLELDAVGGVALCVAGLAMRRQPAGSRILLGALGLSELAVVALSSTESASGSSQGTDPVGRLRGSAATPSDQVGYPPLDTPKPISEMLFIVDSVMPGVMGMVLPVRMTVIRLADGDLLLHSPTRFSLAPQARAGSGSAASATWWPPTLHTGPFSRTGSAHVRVRPRGRHPACGSAGRCAGVAYGWIVTCPMPPRQNGATTSSWCRCRVAWGSARWPSSTVPRTHWC